MAIIDKIEDVQEELEMVAQFYNENPTAEDAYDAFINECQLNGFNPTLTEQQFALAWGGIDAFIDVFTFLDHDSGKLRLGSAFNQ